VNPFEFLDEFFIPNSTRVLGLSVGEDFVILARFVFTQCQRVTDRLTDGRLSDHSYYHFQYLTFKNITSVKFNLCFIGVHCWLSLNESRER